jgi:hypothetical protein
MTLDVFVDLPTALMLASSDQPWKVALVNPRRKETLIAEGCGVDRDVTCVYHKMGSRQTVCVSSTLFEQQSYRRLDERGYAYHPKTRRAPEA